MTPRTETLDALIAHAKRQAGKSPDSIQVSGRFMHLLVREITPKVVADGYPEPACVYFYGGVPIVVSTKLGRTARARAVRWEN